jgi:hypothetical protein
MASASDTGGCGVVARVVCAVDRPPLLRIAFALAESGCSRSAATNETLVRVDDFGLPVTATAAAATPAQVRDA